MLKSPVVSEKLFENVDRQTGGWMTYDGVIGTLYIVNSNMSFQLRGAKINDL